MKNNLIFFLRWLVRQQVPAIISRNWDWIWVGWIDWLNLHHQWKYTSKKIENIGDTVEIPVVSGNEMLINETCYAMAFNSENPPDISSKSSRLQRFPRNHIMATVTIKVQFCSKLKASSLPLQKIFRDAFKIFWVTEYLLIFRDKIDHVLI